MIVIISIENDTLKNLKYVVFGWWICGGFVEGKENDSLFLLYKPMIQACFCISIGRKGEVLKKNYSLKMVDQYLNNCAAILVGRKHISLPFLGYTSQQNISSIISFYLRKMCT